MKDAKEWMATLAGNDFDIGKFICQVQQDAIDTVVSEVEKPTPTLEQSDDKRLLLSAYLQGKRDQIYWATKWEELKPIGRYRIMKQFLNWYQTLTVLVYGKVGINSANLSSHDNFIKSTNVAIWNDAPLCYIQC